MEPVVQIVLAAAGAVLAFIAIGWRMMRRRRASLRIRTALCDADPATRLAALRVAGQRGLSDFADVLVERAHTEQDERVRRALADIVVSNQWEPAVSRELVDLRMWAESMRSAEPPAPEIVAEPAAVAASGAAAPARAAGQATPARAPAPAVRPDENREGPATAEYSIDSTTADEQILREMGLMISGSALTGINVPPDSVKPAVPAEGKAGGPSDARPGPPPLGAAHDAAAGVQTSSPAIGGLAGAPTAYGVGPGQPSPGAHQAVGIPQPQRRSEFRPQSSSPVIIVTGAGGPAGVAVIRALTDLGYRVVGADPDGLSAGLRLAGQPAVVPKADDHAFVERLCDVAVQTGARAVIPTVAEELLALSQGREMLAQAGLAAWLPDPEAVLACVDKWRFAQQTAAAGIPIPTTNLGTANGVPGSWVVKPRFGRGSRDVYFVTRPEELEWAIQRVDEPIVQTRLSGWEFTVDVLVDSRGMLVGAVPRWRLETKAGISTRGRTFANDQLVVGVARLVSALGLVGAANLQGFIGPEGKFVFVEANPRFSGGLPLSLAAGADLVGEYVRGVLGEPIRPDRLTYRPGVTMIRHFEEIFE